MSDTEAEATRRALVRQGERALARQSNVWRDHIKRVGHCGLGEPSPKRSHFEALARSIVFQQLAGNAANAIWLRVVAAVPGRFNAKNLMSVPDEDLRAAGLSNNKLLSLRDLSTHVIDKKLHLASVAKLEDEELIEELVQVRGIGRWTAEMFLMFQVGRLDIWPTGDLGVRNGFARLHGLEPSPTPKALEALGENLRPYRSIAAWYCWRAVDTLDPGSAT